MTCNVSVAIATYNGEKYIKKQLLSIIKQLAPNDEIVVSDDGSTDKTLDIINSLNDKRIKIIEGPHKGVKQNFGNAIKYCKGKYIFLSDQDDIWMNNKVNTVLEAFKSNDTYMVQHDCTVVDIETNNIITDSYFKYRGCKRGIIKNIIKGSYIGCCMAFDSKIKDKILPIPDNIDMHDQWVGLICDYYKKNVFIKDKLINYQRHANTASDFLHHHSLLVMIRDRYNLIIDFIKRIKK